MNLNHFSVLIPALLLDFASAQAQAPATQTPAKVQAAAPGSQTTVSAQASAPAAQTAAPSSQVTVSAQATVPAPEKSPEQKQLDALKLENSLRDESLRKELADLNAKLSKLKVEADLGKTQSDRDLATRRQKLETQ